MVAELANGLELDLEARLTLEPEMTRAEAEESLVELFDEFDSIVPRLYNHLESHVAEGLATADAIGIGSEVRAAINERIQGARKLLGVEAVTVFGKFCQQHSL